MQCPNDNTEMHQVMTQSHYGQRVIVEQCVLCGGIWFDKSELHTIKQGEAEKVEQLSMNKLQAQSAFENKKFLCPKDKSELLEFKDSFFPKDIVIDRCRTCDGFWLNRGEFLQYQEGRQMLKNKESEERQEGEIDENVMKILETHSSRDTTEALDRLGKFLSTPINRFTMRPFGDKKKKTKKDVIINTIIQIVSLLLVRR